ncbi:TetR/AcrR family transcriptional regulator [Edaphobacter aggregans]|uniref:TetR/AcrR family transcriptional regulator n=1 Tax=Edaphobacter aggregans TaxID=570835 RepID=UPI000AB14B24|nr:TetR/AcrR family transcriptional regulator [Edaphobacter aggregans]
MAKGERASQRQRTRHDLLQAASRLMSQGQLPKLAEVAKEAMVSRATAYRYFSSDEALMGEAALVDRTPTAGQLFTGDTSVDPEERLLKANAFMHDFVWENQTQLRFIVARLLDQAAQSNGSGEMPRGNRRDELYSNGSCAGARSVRCGDVSQAVCCGRAGDRYRVDDCFSRRAPDRRSRGAEGGELDGKRSDAGRSARISREEWQGSRSQPSTRREER